MAGAGICALAPTHTFSSNTCSRDFSCGTRGGGEKSGSFVEGVVAVVVSVVVSVVVAVVVVVVAVAVVAVAAVVVSGSAGLGGGFSSAADRVS